MATMKRGRETAHEYMKITPLGAGNEVGRSCHILQYKDKTIMFDCGIHPGYSGMAAMPFFDEIDPADIDILFVSHFHLDHVASLPYFTERTTFKGKVYATHPTKAVSKLMLSDYVRVTNVSTDELLYSEQELESCMNKIEAVDFHQTIVVDGIKFQMFNAGHVLGAAMIFVEIAGSRVLYTGDYSCEDDRHLMKAEPPVHLKPHVLMVEATYGVQNHESREVRETRFINTIQDIVVNRGGKCLIPVFALGRAQELLLILEEYWARNPALQKIPIYFASKLAQKSLSVYQTYLSHMNAHVQASANKNPFKFDYITSLSGKLQMGELDKGPCVVMASPGMLQSGLSRELFDRWCPHAKNGVIIAGYSVEGTLAKKILNAPKEVQALSGRILPLKCSVDYISFSAHADCLQTSNFVGALRPPHVVLVHGEANEMRRLQERLSGVYRDTCQVVMPKNCETLSIRFREERTAKAIGSIAKRRLDSSTRLTGIMIAKDFNYSVLTPAELEEFTELSAHVVEQTLHVPFRQAFAVFYEFLSAMFDDIEELKDAASETERILLVAKRVRVQYVGSNRLVLSWVASPASDMIADSIASVALHVSTSSAGVRATSGPSRHTHSHGPATRSGPDPIRVLKQVLHEHFGTVVESVSEGDRVLALTYRGIRVHVATIGKSVQVTCPREDTAAGTSTDSSLAARQEEAVKRVTQVVDRAWSVLHPVKCPAPPADVTVEPDVAPLSSSTPLATATAVKAEGSAISMPALAIKSEPTPA